MTLRRLLSLLLAAAAASGCRSSGRTVKLAVALPLTGDLGTDGQGLKRAIDLAVEEENASGRLPFRVDVLALDDRADPKEAVTVANQAAADPGVVAVIGHLTSGCSIPASRIYARAGVPMLTPTAVNSQLTLQQLQPDWDAPRLIFRLPALDSVQGPAAAAFARKTGWRRVAVVHDKTAFGQPLAERFRDAFREAGGSVVAYDAVAVGDKDFKGLLTRLKSLKPDGLFYGGVHAEFGLLAKQARELGLRCGLLSGTGAKSNSLFDVAGEAAEGVYVAASGRPVLELPEGAAFVQRFRKRWPGVELTPFEQFGYAAAQALLASLEKSGADRTQLALELRKRPHDTVLGPVEFDDKGDNLDQTVSITRADLLNRRFVAVR